MSDRDAAPGFVFPRWSNYVVPGLILAIVLGMPFVAVLIYYGLGPTTLTAQYRPEQPISFSHELHVTELGMDCRYCHTAVEDAAFAAIPPTSSCMSCHHAIHPESPKLEALYDSFRDGVPVRWRKVHDLPEYAYFDHSAHVNKGVSCVECHGRVDRMGEEGVSLRNPLNMGWCLECHRDPAPHLRPVEEVTNLMWGLDLSDAERREIGEQKIESLQISSLPKMQDCSLCHR